MSASLKGVNDSYHIKMLKEQLIDQNEWNFGILYEVFVEF